MRQHPPLEVVFAQQPNLATIAPLIIGSSQLDVLAALNNVPDSFRYAVLKKLVEHNENNSLDIDGAVIEAYAQYMVSPPRPQQKSPVVYHLTGHQKLVLNENRTVLSAAGGTGHRTWEAAKALVDFLTTTPQFVTPPKIIELGAGCGLVGLAIALLKQQMGEKGSVSITDGDALLVPQIDEHIKSNSLENYATATELLWGEPTELNCDLVVAADVLYDPECYTALIETVRDLHPSNGMLISATIRNQANHDNFKKLCLAGGLQAKQLKVYVPEDASSPYMYLAPGPPIEILHLEWTPSK